jgi:lipopolysaccharide/colanic/teichoic acid biosynthesis glycosyltransferase
LGGYPEIDPEFQPIPRELRAAVIQGWQYGRWTFEERPAAWTVVAAGERACAFLLLAALSPVLIVAGAVVVLLSRQCPLVAHARVGRNGKEVRVLKLRTMWSGAASGPGRIRHLVEHLRLERVPEAKKSDDPRVTSAFAAFCRKYSIDELPQLWHVIRGDLALVGPRPLTADELIEHYGASASEVLRLKPGLTGLWQIRGRSYLTYPQRRRLDLFLVRNWSFRLYAGILLATIPKVLTGKDAW